MEGIVELVNHCQHSSSLFFYSPSFFFLIFKTSSVVFKKGNLCQNSSLLSGKPRRCWKTESLAASCSGWTKKPSATSFPTGKSDHFGFSQGWEKSPFAVWISLFPNPCRVGFLSSHTGALRPWIQSLRSCEDGPLGESLPASGSVAKNASRSSARWTWD